MHIPPFSPRRLWWIRIKRGWGSQSPADRTPKGDKESLQLLPFFRSKTHSLTSQVHRGERMCVCTIVCAFSGYVPMNASNRMYVPLAVLCIRELLDQSCWDCGEFPVASVMRVALCSSIWCSPWRPVMYPFFFCGIRNMKRVGFFRVIEPLSCGRCYLLPESPQLQYLAGWAKQGANTSSYWKSFPLSCFSLIISTSQPGRVTNQLGMTFVSIRLNIDDGGSPLPYANCQLPKTV